MTTLLTIKVYFDIMKKTYFGGKMKKLFAITLSLVFVLALFGCAPEYGGENNHKEIEYRTTMPFYDGFKILQLTDLHLGIESDLEQQLGLVKKYIMDAQPDLIILTGDNFMYANKSIVYNLIKTLNDSCSELTKDRGRLTKFAITYGNHDNQGDYPRYYMNEVIMSFTTKDGQEIKDNKYGAFVDYEDDRLFGFTNYFIDLVDESNPDDVKYRVHIIDSNTYHYDGTKYKYDVIHEEQLAHAYNIYQNATEDNEYIGLAFFHIPLCEYQEAWDQYKESSNPDQLGQGLYEEPVLHPYENNGSYKRLRDANIVAFFAGHDHINYGDLIYTDNDGQKSILSYGVKATNQLYHNEEMIGYKAIVLKDNVTKEEFVTIDYIKENFENVKTGYEYYE